MKTKKKTILIIGGYGFLGHHLLLDLAQNHQVVIAIKSSSISPKVLNTINFIKYYVDSPSFLSDLKNHHFDCVINAAVNYGRKSTPEEIWATNVNLPRTILEATSHKDFLFIHFDTFYNKFPKYTRLPVYQSTKRAFNQYLGETSMGKIITLQLEHLYGPRDNEEKFLPQLLNMLTSEKKEIKLTSAEQRRDFIFILDLVDLVSIIITQKESLSSGFYTFEVGTGISISLKRFIKEIKRQLKSSSILAFGKHPMDKDEIMESYANLDAVQQCFNWQPKVLFEEGISKLISHKNRL